MRKIGIRRTTGTPDIYRYRHDWSKSRKAGKRPYLAFTRTILKYVLGWDRTQALVLLALLFLILTYPGKANAVPPQYYTSDYKVPDDLHEMAVKHANSSAVFDYKGDWFIVKLSASKWEMGKICGVRTFKRQFSYRGTYKRPNEPVEGCIKIVKLEELDLHIIHAWYLEDYPYVLLHELLHSVYHIETGDMYYHQKDYYGVEVRK